MIQTTSHSLHRIGSITQEKARTKIAYIVAESQGTTNKALD
jgi:hypothetical protein